MMILEWMVNGNSEVNKDITQNKNDTNLLKDILQAQILEIEAQLMVKNSEISDLESMMNPKVQSIKNNIEESKKIDEEIYENRKQASTKNFLI